MQIAKKLNEMNYEKILRNCKTFPHFEKIGIYPRHGISIPLFSLRTKNSLGIGEFYDLIPLIDWMDSLNMNIIQLLPINDCGMDPSPYNALSSCALNPAYLSLRNLPGIEKTPSLLKEIEAFSKQNEKPFVEWKKVQDFKQTFLRQYYDLFFTKVEKQASYQTFVCLNPWLEEYALYKTFKKLFSDAGWIHFPETHQKVLPEEMKKYLDLHKSTVDYYMFIQYLCHKQLSDVKKHADKKKILLKGDIPILLSGDSADVYFHRHLFVLDLQAGAPPDFYNSQGQNWHFPLYDWEKAKKSHFHWWKRRLQSQQDYFHCYRVDHVVGFFRIWAISKGKTAMEGKFQPVNLYLWPSQGKELLEMMIESSDMLPLAEDLGTVPSYVFQILKGLGILGTRITRWNRYFEEDGSFLPIDAYEPLTMTSLSTHDAEPTKLWWQNYPLDAKNLASFLNEPYEKELNFETHKKILDFSHRTYSLFHINPLQEYTTLFKELSWDDLEDERINIPGTHSQKNWSYRTRRYLEELAEHKELNDFMRNLTIEKK